MGKTPESAANAAGGDTSESDASAAMARYDFGAAAAAFEKRLADSPGEPALLAGLARAMALLGQYDAAREILRRRGSRESP